MPTRPWRRSAPTLSEEHRFGKRPLKGHFLRLTASADLQANASGLLVFTQDWKILRKLTADAAKIEQEYVVEVEGDMVAHGLNRLNHGLTYKAKSCRRSRPAGRTKTACALP
jgi:23S rRNA pseudouridine2604 synthase